MLATYEQNLMAEFRRKFSSEFVSERFFANGLSYNPRIFAGQKRQKLNASSFCRYLLLFGQRVSIHFASNLRDVVGLDTKHVGYVGVLQTIADLAFDSYRMYPSALWPTAFFRCSGVSAVVNWREW